MCERGFKRLQECWECYSDKLTEPGVYQPLLAITAKLRRGAKAQFKVPHKSSLFHFHEISCLLMAALCPQAQVDEFEKLLTAVHTRGLENVESPEMDEENPKEGSSERTVMRTPLPARGRARSKRGQWSCTSIGGSLCANLQTETFKCVFFYFCRSSKAITLWLRKRQFCDASEVSKVQKTSDHFQQ